MSRQIQYLALLLIVSTAAALVWISSPWGLATSPDSIHYLREARKLLHGADVFELSTRTPPLYPLLLAGVARVDGNLLDGARLLHPLVFACNALLFAAVAWRGGPIGVASSLLAVLAFVLSPVVYQTHVHILSETPFVTCLLGGMFAVRRYIDGAGTRWLAAAAIALGLGTLTRYSGLAFVGASALLLLSVPDCGRLARLRNALGFVALALCLPAAWLAGSLAWGAGGAPRTSAFHLVGAGHLLMGWQTLLDFCGREVVGDAGAAVVLLLAIALLVQVALTSGSRDPAARMVRAGLLFGGVYAAFLLVSISFADYYTPLNWRIMLPVWVILLLLLPACTVAGGRGRFAGAPPLVGCAVAALLLVVLGLGLPELRGQVHAGMNEGIGYFGRQIRSMPMLGVLAGTRLPAVASNAPEVLEVYLGHDAAQLPAYIERVQDRPRPEYEAEMDRLVADVAAGRTVIVWFAAFRWRDHLPGGEVFDDSLHLPVLYRGRDGVIYGTPSAVRAGSGTGHHRGQ